MNRRSVLKLIAALPVSAAARSRLTGKEPAGAATSETPKAPKAPKATVGEWSIAGDLWVVGAWTEAGLFSSWGLAVGDEQVLFHCGKRVLGVGDALDVTLSHRRFPPLGHRYYEAGLLRLVAPWRLEFSRDTPSGPVEGVIQPDCSWWRQDPDDSAFPICSGVELRHEPRRDLS